MRIANDIDIFTIVIIKPNIIRIGKKVAAIGASDVSGSDLKNVQSRFIEVFGQIFSPVPMCESRWLFNLRATESK